MDMEFIKSIVSDTLNPTFENIASQDLLFSYGDEEINMIGYTGNINEKEIEIGNDTIRVIEITSNNLLFDPDKVSILSFDFTPMTNSIIIDGNTIEPQDTIENLITKVKELGDGYLCFSDENKVIIAKFQPLTSKSKFNELYIEGDGASDFGIEIGFYETNRSKFLINGYSYYIRENSVRPCYMGLYMKFQLIRK